MATESGPTKQILNTQFQSSYVYLIFLLNSLLSCLMYIFTFKNTIYQQAVYPNYKLVIHLFYKVSVDKQSKIAILTAINTTCIFLHFGEKKKLNQQDLKIRFIEVRAVHPNKNFIRTPQQRNDSKCHGNAYAASAQPK